MYPSFGFSYTGVDRLHSRDGGTKMASGQVVLTYSHKAGAEDLTSLLVLHIYGLMFRGSCTSHRYIC